MRLEGVLEWDGAFQVRDQLLSIHKSSHILGLGQDEA